MLIILSFILFSFFSSILFIKSGNVYGGSDTQFHFKRIIELVASFRKFVFLPNFSFNEFHGSSVFTLYPYITLLPATIFSFFIESKVLLIYILFVFNTFITLVISYYSSLNYIKSYSISYIFAVIYGMSNIFLTYNLIITDFGIVYSFMFLPLIIFGFLKLINNKRYIELTIGMVLLSFSHILNLIIITLFLLLWLIINIKKLNKYIIINLIKSIILFCIMSSIVWLPLLHFYIYNFSNINMPFSRQLENINIKIFLSGIYGSKNADTIGFFPIITIFLPIFFYKYFNGYIKQMYYLSLSIIIVILFLPWKYITSYNLFGFFNQLQQVNRFLIIPIILLSFIFSFLISRYNLSINKKIMIYIIIILISVLLQLIFGQYSLLKSKKNDLPLNIYLKSNNNTVDINNNNYYYKFNNNYQFNQLMSSYQDTNDDYIPKSSLHLSQYVNHDIGFYDNVHEIKVKHIGYNTFNFSGNNINKISLPIYVYNKEQLHVYLNNKLVNNYADKNGLLTINDIHNDIKPNNKIYIKPKIDLFRFIGAILSILGWLFSISIVIKRKFIH